MLKPFYQGKLDTFCAIYAVLNAFQLTHGMRSAKARDILNETLMVLAANPQAFQAVLEQTTDYITLVDFILQVQSKKMPLEVQRPFSQAVNEDELYHVFQNWLQQPGETSHRAIIFRFLRYLKPDQKPLNRHWTTADRITPEILHLFDSSHEAEAILNIPRNSFVTSPERLSQEKLLYIQPESVRLLRLPF